MYPTSDARTTYVWGLPPDRPTACPPARPPDLSCIDSFAPPRSLRAHTSSPPKTLPLGGGAGTGADAATSCVGAGAAASGAGAGAITSGAGAGASASDAGAAASCPCAGAGAERFLLMPRVRLPLPGTAAGAAEPESAGTASAAMAAPARLPFGGALGFAAAAGPPRAGTTCSQGTEIGRECEEGCGLREWGAVSDFVAQCGVT